MERRSSTRLAIEESKKTFAGTSGDGGGHATHTTTVPALGTSGISKGKKKTPTTTKKSLTAPKTGGGVSKNNSPGFTLRYFFSKTTDEFTKAAPNAKKKADDVEIKLQVGPGRRPRSEWPEVVTMDELRRVYQERTGKRIRDRDWESWGRKLRAEVQEEKEMEGDEMEEEASSEGGYGPDIQR
jgi:hypothetical protein